MSIENGEPNLEAITEKIPHVDSQENEAKKNPIERLKFLIARLEKGEASLEKGEASLETGDWKELGIYAGISGRKELLEKVGLGGEEDSQESLTPELNNLFTRLTREEEVEVSWKQGRDVAKLFAVLVMKFRAGNLIPRERNLIEEPLKKLGIETSGNLESLKSLLESVKLSEGEEIVGDSGGVESEETSEGDEPAEN